MARSIEPTGRQSVRPMTAADVNRVAELHIGLFRHNVAVRFGARFVRQYIGLFLDSPAATAQVVAEDERVVGYLLGVTSTADHRPFVRTRRLDLVLAALPRLVSNIGFITKVGARKVRTRLRRQSAASDPQPGPVAVLSHIAVCQAARRHGAGTALVEAFERTVLEYGTQWAVLATIDGEDGAGDFYDRRGWREVSHGITVDARRLRIYEKTLAG